MEAASYYVRSRGKVVGPLGLAALKQMARRGQLGRATEVSIDRSSWVMATEVEGLFDATVLAPVAVGAATAEPPHAEGDVQDVKLVKPTQVDSLVPFTQGGYYFAQRGQTVGPVPLEALKAMCINGTVAAQDPIWREGDSGALPADRVPVLAALFTASSEQSLHGATRGPKIAPTLNISVVGPRVEDEAWITSMLAAIVAVMLTFIPTFVINGESKMWWSLMNQTDKGMLVAGYVATLLLGLSTAVVVPLLRGKVLAVFLLVAGGSAAAAIMLHMLAEHGPVGLAVSGHLLLAIGVACGMGLTTARACLPFSDGLKAALLVTAIGSTLLALLAVALAVALVSGYGMVAGFTSSRVAEAWTKLFLLMWLVSCFGALVSSILSIIAASIMPSRGLLTAQRIAGDGCIAGFLIIGVILSIVPRELNEQLMQYLPIVSYVLVIPLTHGLRMVVLAAGGR